MISPAMFAEFWKSAYQRVYRHAHRRGMLTLLHSCGNIADLLDYFIEAELDVIQMDQQENMGLDNLAARFGGRLCFWCPVDIQKMMVYGSAEDVRNYVKRMMATIGNHNGGLCSMNYPAPESVGHTPEKVAAMCAAFRELGVYPDYQIPSAN